MHPNFAHALNPVAKRRCLDDAHLDRQLLDDPIKQFDEHEQAPVGSHCLGTNHASGGFKFQVLTILNTSLFLSLSLSLSLSPHKRSAVLRTEESAVAPPEECCVASRGGTCGPTRAVNGVAKS